MRGLFVIATALLFSSCGDGRDAPPAASPTAPRYPLAAAQNVDAAGLEGAFRVLSTHPQAECLLVERNGVVIFEEYFRGRGPADAFDLRSVTKSVTSILIGIAIEEGLIRGLDQTVGDTLSPVVVGLDPQKAGISIRHLLTMTSGLPWRELGSVEQDYNPWVNSPDPLLWILSRPLEHEPGTVWNYNTGASHILSAILTEATGASARAYAEQRLFGPLDSGVGPWPADNRGYNFGGHGISLSGRTMIRLGRLFLDGGAYRGRQIVSSAWVRESITPRYSTGYAPAFGARYGYFWWIGRDERTGLDFYYATGYGGQFVLNVPARNTTIAAATAFNVPNANENWTLVLRTIVERILPGLR
jgi:CubicO group peptidase (beta-lactamase class C family)